MNPPVLDLTTAYTTPPAPINVPIVDLAAAGVASVIDIRTTRITDGEKSALLSDVFKIVEAEGEAAQLAIDSGTLVTDGENKAAFDFQYDEVSEKFGAGTAFLQDAES